MSVNFRRKLRTAKELVMKGKYREFFSSLHANILSLLGFADSPSSVKYLWLKKKYSAFIADKVMTNLRNGGGVKLLIHPISYGDCGFREKRMRRMYASHVCVL